MQKKMLRKSSLLYCLRSNENYSFNLDLVACAASDRIDEKGIYSQPIRFQIWPPSKTKFAEMHVKSFKGKFPESLRIAPRTVYYERKWRHPRGMIECDTFCSTPFCNHVILLTIIHSFQTHPCGKGMIF